MSQQNTPLISQDNYNYQHLQKKQIPQFQRKKGTDFLLNNQYQKASKSYSKAIMAFEYLVKDNVITPQQIKVMLKDTVIPCYSNLALTFLKLKQYQSVVQFTNRVIQIDSNNTKAFYRRGVAYKNLKKYRESKQDLNRVILLDETMKEDVLMILRQIKQLEIKQRQKQKRIAQALINNYGQDKPNISVNSSTTQVGFFKKTLNKIKDYCSKFAKSLKLKKK